MALQKRRVVYRATFVCDVSFDPEEEPESDAISNIDIPEGGINESVYRDNSFEIIEVRKFRSSE